MLPDRCNTYQRFFMGMCLLAPRFPFQVLVPAGFTSKMCYVISLLFVIYFEIDAIRIKR